MKKWLLKHWLLLGLLIVGIAAAVFLMATIRLYSALQIQSADTITVDVTKLDNLLAETDEFRWVWSADMKRKVQQYQISDSSDWQVWHWDDWYNACTMIDKVNFIAFRSINEQDCIDYVDSITDGGNNE